MPTCIKDCISSDDPLSEEIINYLITYHEETELIDFKISIENVEKEWLEITKDVLAFSNTYGGYLIFGIKNATFEIAGLSEESLSLITDANKFMQKVNRNVDPPISLIRCKHFKVETKDLVAIYIPASRDKTHLVSKDASFTHISGKTQLVLREGTSYVRKSAGNHLIDSRAFDDIVNRRISYFKSTLLENITKIVEAPKDSAIFVLSQDKSNPDHTRFVIEDSPDAIPIKGLSFTISPDTIEEEIAGWIAMTKREPVAKPSAEITWKWYRERDQINLSTEQRLWVARYSLQTMVPAFYWLRDCDATNISHMLNEALLDNDDVNSIGEIISTSAFLGKRYHQALISRAGKFASRLPPASLSIPHNGPKTLFRADKIKAKPEQLEKELNNIANSSKLTKSHIPITNERYKAQALDCFLYAQENQYINKKK